MCRIGHVSNVRMDQYARSTLLASMRVTALPFVSEHVSQHDQRPLAPRRDPIIGRFILMSYMDESCVQDMFTSMTSASKPHHVVDADGVTLGYTHFGMLAAARYIRAQVCAAPSVPSCVGHPYFPPLPWARRVLVPGLISALI